MEVTDQNNETISKYEILDTISFQDYQIKKILLASSLNENKTKDIITWSSRYAKELGAELELVHIVKPRSVWYLFYHFTSFEDSISDDIENAKIKLFRIKNSLPESARNIKIKTHFACKDDRYIADEIINISKDNYADLIIVESQYGKKRSSRLDKICRNSKASILILGQN